MDNDKKLDLYTVGIKTKDWVGYFIDERYVRCFRAEDDSNVLAKKCLYKEYTISPKHMLDLVTNQAIGQLIRGADGKCDDGWCLFTINPRVLLRPFSENEKRSYIDLKNNPTILSMEFLNPVNKSVVEAKYSRGENLTEHPCMPVSARIGNTWYTMDEIFESKRFSLDDNIINEFVLFLCNDAYLKLWYDSAKKYHSNYGCGHNGWGDQQEAVCEKQKLILHYGTSTVETTELIALDEFKKNVNSTYFDFSTSNCKVEVKK